MRSCSGSSPEYRSIYESRAGAGASLVADATLSPVVEEQKPKSLRRLLHYLLAARGKIALTCLLSFVGTTLALIPAVQVGRIINGPIADGDKTRLAIDLLIMLAFAAGGILGMWLGGRVLAVAAQDAMYGLRSEMFEHTQTCRCGSSTASPSAI